MKCIYLSVIVSVKALAERRLVLRVCHDYDKSSLLMAVTVAPNIHSSLKCMAQTIGEYGADNCRRNVAHDMPYEY